MVALMLVVLGSCAPAGGAPTRLPTSAPTPTVEEKLATVAGDPASAAEFGRILDLIQAGTAVCRPEPDRLHVGDVLVASWEVADKPDTLLEWARAAAAVCRAGE